MCSRDSWNRLVLYMASIENTRLALKQAVNSLTEGDVMNRCVSLFVARRSNQCVRCCHHPINMRRSFARMLYISRTITPTILEVRREATMRSALMPARRLAITNCSCSSFIARTRGCTLISTKWLWLCTLWVILINYRSGWSWRRFCAIEAEKGQPVSRMDPMRWRRGAVPDSVLE